MTEFWIWFGGGVFVLICSALSNRRPHNMNETDLHDLATHSRVRHNKELTRGSYDK